MTTVLSGDAVESQLGAIASAVSAKMSQAERISRPTVMVPLLARLKLAKQPAAALVNDENVASTGERQGIVKNVPLLERLRQSQSLKAAKPAVEIVNKDLPRIELCQPQIIATRLNTYDALLPNTADADTVAAAATADIAYEIAENTADNRPPPVCPQLMQQPTSSVAWFYVMSRQHSHSHLDRTSTTNTAGEMLALKHALAGRQNDNVERFAFDKPSPDELIKASISRKKF